ncbi:MAG: 16S rRNA (adenine(1518)-N(6)/adenine(1519)-N(6))-dimethyltransferase RsmA [Bacteroidetes bacterium]|nr:16S rRNA (adenine(1518)-N(6)/adenine(1519)-N(6))-dimethyltransferase RsmA [Bacteroidota bacterium]
MTSVKQKYDAYKPKRKFGQNFLVDDNIARKIIKSLGADEKDTVIEIGPGHGALTKFLFREFQDFTAVEIDETAVAKLIKNYPGLNVVHGDILDFDFSSPLKDSSQAKVKVIGNIPYNITSVILFRLLDKIEAVDSAVLMIQKEVAERLAATKETKQYGILSVQFQAFADIKTLFNVPRTAFFPKPDVTSSVIRLQFKPDKYTIANTGLFRTIVRNAFSKRRKTLKNSLKDFFESNNIRTSDFSLDFSRRAETLSVDEFVVLSNEVNSYLRGPMII